MKNTAKATKVDQNLFLSSVTSLWFASVCLMQRSTNLGRWIIINPTHVKHTLMRATSKLYRQCLFAENLQGRISKEETIQTPISNSTNHRSIWYFNPNYTVE